MSVVEDDVLVHRGSSARVTLYGSLLVLAVIMLLFAPATLAATGPRLALSVLTPGSIKVHAQGELTLGALACKNAKDSCIGNVALRPLGGARSAASLATGSIRLRAGRTTVVTIRLTPRARSALSREHRLRAVIKVQVRDQTRRLATLTAKRTLVPGSAVGCWPIFVRGTDAPGPSSSTSRLFTYAAGPGSAVTYGCLYRLDHAFPLDNATTGTITSPIEFAGPYIASQTQGAFGPAGTVPQPFWDVVAWDLNDGRRLHLDRLGTGNAKEPLSLVVSSSDGAIAWVYGYPGGTLQVDADDASGYHVLDSGTGIDPSSLRISGKIVTWVDGAQTRSATLE